MREDSIRTVDNIPYLCYVADTGEFSGSNSPKVQEWIDANKPEYYQSNELNWDQWAIKKYIPLVKRIENTDISMLTLPKVFRYDEYLNITTKRLQSMTQQASMDCSINTKDKLVLIL